MNEAYVVIHVATTCDEHGVYVTKDSAEVIEMAWILLNSNTLEEIHRDSVLVRPINTPITALCTSLTTLTFDHVRTAGTFRDAITRFDNFAQEYLISKGTDFTFVTLNAWDLRVQLPREARDKGVILPPYLQHSRSFDLRTEYSRWQTHHPESLPFSSSSLSNICAALEVESVQSSAPIKHNLPFHLQALAPASPRRAMEEAITLGRVLRGLIKKSQPPEQHPDVLAKPLDTRADVRAFLAERSKVLHLSNLPHDTTQSELESWFTQYGGRPIAFWTLRTPDQHKPTGTGFAVFSSHEEAAESLAMNGRALNEKAIEVSPSSSRVLDRAHEILTPFPPSKNRPRPGDWTCPSCGFSNFQRRTACFRCSYPSVAATPSQEQMFQYGNYQPPPLMPQHNSNGMPMGGNGRGNNGSFGMVPFRAGDWKCGTEGCGYHNFAKNVACLRCGASRAGAAVVADPTFPNGMMDPAGGNSMQANGGLPNRPASSQSLHQLPSIGSGKGGNGGPNGFGHPNGGQYGGPTAFNSPISANFPAGAFASGAPLSVSGLATERGDPFAGLAGGPSLLASGPVYAGGAGAFPPDDSFSSFFAGGLSGLSLVDDGPLKKRQSA
ncbi:uncharacterized protein V1510DRAFT_396086 [Dipodascopsis tothii]|uniref:uncharacterized protein n=1 Tax=Dipodascopsis tothii TaxID=44089 RepID=UPI0034CDF958